MSRLMALGSGAWGKVGGALGWRLWRSVNVLPCSAGDGSARAFVSGMGKNRAEGAEEIETQRRGKRQDAKEMEMKKDCGSPGGSPRAVQLVGLRLRLGGKRGG
jgi:hypothetical protein